MKFRDTLPDYDNLYYIGGARGFNPCILGNPNNRPYPDSVLANCIGSVCGRANELYNEGGCVILGNAYPGYMIGLAKRQGLEIWDKAAVGGTIVMVKENGIDGHVISVEKIGRAGLITTFESGWNYQPGTYFINRNITKAGNFGCSSAYQFAGCILNPKVDPYPFTMEYVNKWHPRGEGVKAVQWVLNYEGCYAPGSDNTIDGSCGPATQQAICVYQEKHGLEIDSSAGPITQDSMKELYSIV